MVHHTRHAQQQHSPQKLPTNPPMDCSFNACLQIDWLTGEVGLALPQASQLLMNDVRLLVGPQVNGWAGLGLHEDQQWCCCAQLHGLWPLQCNGHSRPWAAVPVRSPCPPTVAHPPCTPQRQLDGKRARLEELAAHWGVGQQLAAVLCLSQPYLPAGAVDRTARLLEMLQVGHGLLGSRHAAQPAACAIHSTLRLPSRVPSQACHCSPASPLGTHPHPVPRTG